MDEIFKKLGEKYRRLRLDELDEMNSEYSCVICGHVGCNYHNTPNHACPLHRTPTEDEWCEYYSFD